MFAVRVFGKESGVGCAGRHGVCRTRATESGHKQTPPPAKSLASYGKSGAPLPPRAEARGASDQRDQMSFQSPPSPWTSWA